jgi:hypothetical protein
MQGKQWFSNILKTTTKQQTNASNSDFQTFLQMGAHGGHAWLAAAILMFQSLLRRSPVPASSCACLCLLLPFVHFLSVSHTILAIARHNQSFFDFIGTAEHPACLAAVAALLVLARHQSSCQWLVQTTRHSR